MGGRVGLRALALDPDQETEGESEKKGSRGFEHDFIVVLQQERVKSAPSQLH